MFHCCSCRSSRCIVHCLRVLSDHFFWLSRARGASGRERKKRVILLITHLARPRAALNTQKSVLVHRYGIVGSPAGSPAPHCAIVSLVIFFVVLAATSRLPSRPILIRRVCICSGTRRRRGARRDCAGDASARAGRLRADGPRTRVHSRCEGSRRGRERGCSRSRVLRSRSEGGIRRGRCRFCRCRSRR